MNEMVSPIVATTNLAKDALRIRAVKTTIVDLPIRRAHQFAKAKISSQAFLIVEIETESGITGLGEGATSGGPWWSGDSIETMKVMTIGSAHVRTPVTTAQLVCRLLLEKKIHI